MHTEYLGKTILLFRRIFLAVLRAWIHSHSVHSPRERTVGQMVAFYQVGRTGTSRIQRIASVLWGPCGIREITWNNKLYLSGVWINGKTQHDEVTELLFGYLSSRKLKWWNSVFLLLSIWNTWIPSHFVIAICYFILSWLLRIILRSTYIFHILWRS